VPELNSIFLEWQFTELRSADRLIGFFRVRVAVPGMGGVLGGLKMGRGMNGAGAFRFDPAFSRLEMES
jgi:hypothetical protein